jgi:hypothetical protein
MFGLTIQVVVLGAFAWGVWAAVQPRYDWKIRIAGGRPLVRKGKVTAAFLSHVADVCRETGVSRGRIGGERRGRRVALRFSRDFPPGSQQRLRNEWLAMS